MRHRDGPARTIGYLVPVLVIVALLSLVGAVVFQQNKRRKECEDRGGVYVTTGGYRSSSDTCLDQPAPGE